MGEKELTIDDFFKFAESMSKKINEFGTQKGIEEKFAKAMINATDPDSRFKADIAMKLSTAIGMIDMLVTYVNKPVRVEGLLQRKLDGSVMLDSTPIPAGSLVEFWKHDKWNIGRVVQDPKTKQNQIIDPVSNKVVIDKIEQIKARIR